MSEEASKLESDIALLSSAMIRAESAGDMDRAKKYALAYRKGRTKLDLMRQNPGEYDPSSAEFKEQFGAVSDSGVNNFRAGAGKFLFDAGRGIAQILGADNQQSIDEAKSRDSALLGTKAGLAGNIAGGAAFTAPVMLIPGANTVAGSTLVGGATGAAMPTATGESRLDNALLGAGGGFVGAKIGGGLASRKAARQASRASARGGDAAADFAIDAAPTASVRSGPSYGYVGDDVSAGLSAGQQQAAEAGKKLGMRLTPGQATGGKARMQWEAKFASQPMTSGPFNEIADNNQRILNATWARAIGVEGDDLSSPVLAKAYSKMSDVFEAMPQKIGTQDVPTRDAFNLFDSLQSQYSGVTSTPVLNNKLVKEAIGLAEQGQATGAQLRSLTSRLGKRINNELTTPSGDREMGKALIEVKSFVDDIIQSGLSPQDQAIYQATRGRYRNYTLLTRNANALNPADGDIRPRSLAGVLARQDKRGYLLGQNNSDHYSAVRFSQAFQPIVGDSGTATRMPIGISEAVASVPLGAAGRAYTSGPSVAAQAAADGVVGDVARMLGPAADPRLLGLLGANTAVQTGRK